MKGISPRPDLLQIRILILIPVPFLWFLALRASQAAFGTGASPSAVILGVLGGLLPTLIAAFCFFPSRTVRGVAHFSYVLCLAGAFALGSMLSVKDLAEGTVDAVSGSWAFWALVVGAFISAASLLPVTYLIVEDWRTSRRPEDTDVR